MKSDLWYEGVTERWELLFWLLVLAGINVYTWWTHGNSSIAIVFTAFLALFIEFDISTRQIVKLMNRTKELEDQMYLLKDLQKRMCILEAQAK